MNRRRFTAALLSVALIIAMRRSLAYAQATASVLATVAKAAGMDIKTSDLIARGGSLPDFGAITDRDNEIFTLPVGKAGTPSSVGSKTLVFAVKERKSLDPEEIKKGLDPVRTSLQESKRETVFSNWIDEAMKKMEDDRSIKINQTVMTQLTETAR